MQKLIAGLSHFQAHVSPARKALFEKLATGQSPDTLVITCSDSRVTLEMALEAEPGELFVIRNAGNFVPPHPDPSVEATVEYAVQVLKVKHIVVCGHSDCGAMKAVLHPDKVAALPSVAKWIAYGDRARAVALEQGEGKSEADLVRAVIEENVLAQLDNLRTYPSVAAKTGANALQLHGWVFNIKDSSIRAYDSTQKAWADLGTIKT